MTTQRQARKANWAEQDDNKNKKDYTEYPSEPVNKNNKVTSKRTTLGTPGVLKQMGFKTGVFNGHSASNQKEKVDLKITKLRKTPPS